MACTGKLCRRASVGRALAPWSKNIVDNFVSENRKLGARASSVVEPSVTETCSQVHYYYVFLMLLFAATVGPPISAQGDFIVQNASYSWSSDIKFLGTAHATKSGENSSDGRSQVGSLSLLLNDNTPNASENLNSVGLAYYNKPVRLLDPFTRQSASFNTSFAVDTVSRETPPAGDGFTFVISASNQDSGGIGRSFGIFSNLEPDPNNLTTRNATGTFKSIVVEFDSFSNGAPVYDMNGNHVGFDFVSIRSAAAANASNVNVWLANNTRTYAWVEYSNQTQQLEARVSNDNSRPSSPLLAYTVDLFDVSDEHMWVGFSAASGSFSSDYFIKNWTFESSGIDLSSPVPSSPVPSRTAPRGLIVGISVGAFALLLACIFIVGTIHRRYGAFKRYWQPRRTGPIEEDPMVILEGIPVRFSYKQLSVATGNFSEDSKLGQGGFGSVYRGVLPSGIPIAVKKINGNSTQGEKEFMAEVSIISRLRHRNLIQLLGWCLDTSKRNYSLAYELMPNGSLNKVLFGPADKDTACLTWPLRFNIVMGTATALDYLHQGWIQQVIHRDIKSSNIMLDENWNAKLGDFGLARVIDHERTATTTLVAGTYGYIAPEVPVSGRFTDKTDVYAFGAVVLEIACGRKALCTTLPEDEMLLLDWVWQKLSDGDLLSTVDKRLEVYDTYWMEVLLTVGLLCSHPNPLARPTMKHVVQILSGDAPVPSIPASKPTLVFMDQSGRFIDGKFDSKTWSNSTSPSRSTPLVSTNSFDVNGASTVNLASGTSTNANS